LKEMVMKNLWFDLIDCLEAGEIVVTAKVIRHKGSTPRGAGTWMIVRQSGDILGTIGGGVMESQVLKLAVDLFNSKGPSVSHINMTHTELSSTNMICGGKVDVLLDYWEPNDHLRNWCQELKQCLEDRQPAWYAIDLDSSDASACQTGHYLVKGDGEVVSADSENLALDESLKKQLLKSETPSLLSVEDRDIWVEPLQLSTRLFLFGAGHVGRATAVVGFQVGFETAIFDDRSDLLRRDFFPDSVNLNQVDDFSTCIQPLDIDESSYLVIVSRGHMHDRNILAQALKTNAAYIGMIGSRKKRDTIYKNLLESGFDEADLKRVHSPIGLDIGAETPEEIAVSIVAEMIQVRAQKAQS
jgi:xanthine dehydrogenase accessory factor